MENATKALTIAASVLIAVVILGALLLTFNSLSSYQNTNTKNTREAQVIEFNNQYEIFNRKEVRGSDLYSLLNKVVDYNRRKSTDVGKEDDEGKYIAYKSMTVSYDLKNQKSDFTFDGTSRIFKQNDMTVNLTTSKINQFTQLVTQRVDEIGQIADEDGLQNLVVGISNLFGKTNEQDKEKAIKLWNNNAKTKVTKYEELNTDYNRDAIYTYYEFIQFKRAIFECKNVEYDDGTGRIISMSFDFTGKFK